MSATLLCLSFLLCLLFVALVKPNKLARGQVEARDCLDRVQYDPVEEVARQFNFTPTEKVNLLTGYKKLVSELNLNQNKGKVIVYDDNTGILELKTNIKQI
jgi:hypothetical protein